MTPPLKIKMGKREFAVHAKNHFGTKCHGCGRQLEVGDMVVTKQINFNHKRGLYCVACAKTLNIV